MLQRKRGAPRRIPRYRGNRRFRPRARREQGTKEPQVNESIMDVKIKLKLKVSEVESKINAKNKEIEKNKELARTYLKSGNKLEARRYLKKKQTAQKIVERLQSQIQILDDQLMILENIEVNKDISDTLKSVNEKMEQVTINIDIRELEKYVEQLNEMKEINKDKQAEIGEIINQANEDDPDLSDEIELMEAELGGNIPRANNEQLVNDNKLPIQEPADNLVFY